MEKTHEAFQRNLVEPMQYHDPHVGKNTAARLEI